MAIGFVYQSEDVVRSIDIEEATRLIEDFETSSLFYMSWEERERQKLGAVGAIVCFVAAYLLRARPWFWTAISVAAVLIAVVACLGRARRGGIGITPQGFSGWRRDGPSGFVFSFPYDRIALIGAKDGEIWVELGINLTHHTLARPMGRREIETFLRTVKAHQEQGNIPQLAVST